jgi:hypothetical protein
VDGKIYGGPGTLVGTGFGTAAVPRLTVGDVNADGRADLVGQLADGRIQVWASTGSMSDNQLLAAPRTVLSGWTTTAVPRILTGDLNGDGRLDVIRQNAAGELRAWASTGDLSADNRLFAGAGVVVGTGWTIAFADQIL